MAECIELSGELKGHKDWITSLTTSPTNPQIIISGSRDKTVNVWKLTDKSNKSNGTNIDDQSILITGKIIKKLKGHNHFVQSVDISNDGNYIISGSWDKTVRLWNLEKCITQRIFKKHKKDILCTKFSSDNRRIASSSRDNTVYITNTVGKIKKHLKHHTD